MKKLLITLLLVLTLSACKSDLQNHSSIIEHAQVHTTYVLSFEDVFDNFEITKIEYVEDFEYMYYLFHYEGYYTIDVEVLNILMGDKLDSSTLCRNKKDSNVQDCLNGVDVTGDFLIAEDFKNLMDSKDDHNYYLFNAKEITNINN